MSKYTFSVHGISPDTDTVTAYVDVKYSMLPLMSLFSLQVTMDRKPYCSIDYYESQAIKQAQAVIADVVAETNAVNAGMVIGVELKGNQIFMREAFISKSHLDDVMPKTLDQRIVTLEKQLADNLKSTSCGNIDKKDAYSVLVSVETELSKLP
ncbi:YdfR family protein [Morganella morganii]|uniref:YdfR family protein n=1 Tax=Morganella morganii TaxID=582 RepID=UPI0021D0D699|nr:YdfR family protein [Morganella morganii]MCU6375999.1 YdfR family protein [Morganella morganii]